MLIMQGMGLAAGGQNLSDPSLRYKSITNEKKL
jgi:hypothetical protein